MTLPPPSCRYSFDDLYLARFGRKMTADEKHELYSFTQEKRNEEVGEWAKKAGWQFEDRIGTDGQVYTAFWKGNNNL